MTEETITWDDFAKIQMVTGTIIDVAEFPQARKPAYQLTIDFGEKGIRKSSAQLTQLYQPHDLLGRQIVAFINFPPKRIATFRSECLVLGAVGDNGEVTLLQPERTTPNGSLIA